MIYLVIHFICTMILVLASFLYWRSHRDKVTVTKGVLAVWGIMVLFFPWTTMVATPISLLCVYLDEHGDEEVDFLDKFSKKGGKYRK